MLTPTPPSRSITLDRQRFAGRRGRTEQFVDIGRGNFLAVIVRTAIRMIPRGISADPPRIGKLHDEPGIRCALARVPVHLMIDPELLSGRQLGNGDRRLHRIAQWVCLGILLRQHHLQAVRRTGGNPRGGAEVFHDAGNAHAPGGGSGFRNQRHLDIRGRVGAGDGGRCRRTVSRFSAQAESGQHRGAASRSGQQVFHVFLRRSAITVPPRPRISERYYTA